MPIRNVGTLLEQIVVVEAARLVLSIVPERKTVDFLNCFAMPPFSAWTQHDNDPGYSDQDLQHLEDTDEIEDATSYPGLLRACLLTHQGGPNVALMVGLLASLQGRRLKMWLNDLADERVHYANAVEDLQNTANLVAAMSPPNSTIPTVEVCGEPYPDSLTRLRETLDSWQNSEPAGARLGFLDPMKYAVSRDDAAFNHTTRKDHREWLGKLGGTPSLPVLSAHFTGNRNQPVLANELHSMSQDGFERGYLLSIEFRHNYYAVVVNVVGDVAQAVALADRLETSICQAWGQWYTAVAGRRSPCSLVTTRRIKRD
jgi:hypothetical protein